MKLSCVCAVGLFLIGTVAGSSGALALDAPHPLHRARTTQPHLSETHRASGRHSAAHSARSSASPTAARGTAAHSGAQAAPAKLTARGQARASARLVALHSRHHRYYERFTASSFASADQFSGDITAGEDPIVRQAAIDALGDMNGKIGRAHV